MKITVKQLKQLIREQVEEMADMGGAMEGRRGGDAPSVYTPAELKKIARRDPGQLMNIGRDPYVGEPQEAFIKFPSGGQEEISSVTINEYGDVQVNFVALSLDPIALPLASAKRRR